MTKRIGFMALGLSMALLSGCGSSSNDDAGNPGGNPGAGTELNTPAEATKNIVGTWATGCVNENGWSALSTLIMKADGTGSYEEVDYGESDCGGAPVESDSDTFTYVIGEATTGTGGEDAVELDIVLDGGPYYTMIHFTSANRFLMADDNDENSEADTPETRESIFAGQEKWAYTRQ